MRQIVETAMKYHVEGKLDEAAPLYEQALKIYPNEAVIWHNLGDVEYRKRNYKRAVEYLQKAFLLHPSDPNTLNTLAIALYYAGRIDEALKLALGTIKKYPNFVAGYPNVGVISVGHKRLDEAIDIFKKALAAKPDYLQAHLGLGFSYLTKGLLQEGWKEILWCQRHIAPARPYALTKAWNGEDIAGKTLLIYLEQGYGDLFQYIRYIELLVKKGITVLIEECTVDGGLIQRSLPKGSSIYQEGQHFDVACSVMNLGLFYGTTIETIPSMTKYLRASPQKVSKWKKFFAQDTGYKIGLCWSGNPSHLNDVNRSTTLDTFAPLQELEGCSFYGLQKDYQGTPPEGLPFSSLAGSLQTFDDTAAIIMNLDLVITVDTAIAHLAAALGKPTWVLLGFNPDYRWLTSGESTAWYPTMQLFRSEKPNQWPSVIEKIRDRIRKIF